MDGLDLSEAHEALSSYGAAAQKRPEEVLRDLQETVDQSSVWWEPPSGGHGSISSSQILLAYLRKLEADCDQGRTPLASAETDKEELRGVRTESQIACPPCERRHVEQHEEEYPDSLHVLSRLLAQAAAEAWSAYCWPDAASDLNAWRDGWEDGVARVLRNVKQRVPRLRALGNAVVPQVVELIGRAIVEAEAS